MFFYEPALCRSAHEDKNTKLNAGHWFGDPIKVAATLKAAVYILCYDSIAEKSQIARIKTEKPCSVRKV